MNGAFPALNDYRWEQSGLNCAHEYLLPELEKLLAEFVPAPANTRVLDLGCGNGAVTAWLAERGLEVVGVDPSESGIAWARQSRPDLEFHRASAYEPLRARLGSFSLVLCLEVIEHVYDPQVFIGTVRDVLTPGGIAILSTPYHGWLKNVAIALLGRFDRHVHPLSVHGHIKFWSRETLKRLLEGGGFEVLEFRRVGRVPPLAKSMLAVARRPPDTEHPVSGAISRL